MALLPGPQVSHRQQQQQPSWPRATPFSFDSELLSARGSSPSSWGQLTIRRVSCSPHPQLARPMSRRHFILEWRTATWPRGPMDKMDKASVRGAGDCRFESYRGNFMLLQMDRGVWVTGRATSGARKNDLPRTGAWDLRLRRPTPYPSGQQAWGPCQCDKGSTSQLYEQP